MMSRYTDRFLVTLAFLCFVIALVHAIYDPREVTTKPPKQREPVLPWYTPGRVDSSEDLSRSPKWQLDSDSPRKPIVIDAESKSKWSAWKRNQGSDIEQRTEILSGDSQNTTDFDQHAGSSLEYSGVPLEQQQEDKDLPPDGFQKQKDKEKKQDASKGTNSQTVTKDDDQDDFYEGLPPDSKKSRKEKIYQSTKQKLTVARYDDKRGVQCPEFDSTGQFVYPPDCQFFVNCWKGRAFVQPCAPGTLFNPDTLECDFPHKVKCYGKEVADFPSDKHLDSSEDREPLLSGSHQGYMEHGRTQEPRCPPHITGLIAHPSNCTKFLQCANGGTYIMDCAPGTVFNPSISVCDWPNNVRGCEDAVKSKEEVTTPLVPPDYYEDYGNLQHGKLQYSKPEQPRKIACPVDYTGLLPHPDTCKKFLQCESGGTFVMDCGPGTAFNPAISVCDWPYNVPSCNEDKPSRTQHSLGSPTTATNKPWPSYHGSTDSRTWQHTHQHNHTSQGRYRPGYTRDYPNHPVTTGRPRTDWDSLRPTWIPSWKPSAWTTATPLYSQSWQSTNTNPHYGPSNEQTDRDRWDHASGSDREHSQWHQNRYHHHHHRHYHYPHGPVHDSDQNTETQQPVAPQTPGSQGTETGGWHSSHGYQHEHRHYHYGDHGRPETVPSYPWDAVDSGQQTQQPVFDQPGDKPPTRRFDYSSNRESAFEDGNANQGRELTPNRQEYGRTAPAFSAGPGSDVYVDRNYQSSGGGDSRFHVQNRTSWQPVPTGNSFAPSSWGQQGPEQAPNQNQDRNRQWDQGTSDVDDKFREWGSETNIYQSTANKQADSKLNAWPNIFLHGKGQHGSGAKTTSNNSTKLFYPNGIYVNLNDTRGHFITKEIEIDQGHSKTKTYRSNDVRGLNEFDRNDRNVYVDSQTTNFDYIPSAVLQPPPISVVDRSEPENTRHGDSHRYPKTHWTSNWNSASSEDLNESGSHYNRVSVPSSNLQPPYASLNFFSPLVNFSKTDNYSPSTNLQPPFYRPANNTFPIGWQYPSVPSVELQPPFVEPTRRNKQNFTRSLGNFQPLSQLTPPNFVPDVTGQYPHVPSSNLEPPFEESSDRTNDSSVAQFVSSANREIAPENETITTTDSNVPVVWIENESNSNTDYPAVVEPDFDEVDVLVDKRAWKPVLVFVNRTQTTTTESSVIMKINKKKADVDLFNIEAAPFEDEEPPFPSYYIPSVEPMDHSRKTALPTPISGQVIRLRGGSGPYVGYVEVQGTNPGWGIVCDSKYSWTLKEAHVVCKQLGYPSGAEAAWQGRDSRNGVPTWIAANSVSCQDHESKFQSCKFTHVQQCRLERDAVGVRCVQNRVAHCRKDETAHEGQCYHIAESENGLNHQEALDYCTRRQSRLLDITSQAENDFISEWVVQTRPEIASIMTSGVGFTTMNRTLWLWEDASRAKFRFTKWWPGWMGDKKHPPIVGFRPVCIVMKRKFPCHDRPDSICVADYFFWDAEDCAASGKGHSFICKRPYDDIGCIYGKGNQYAGTANVTVSGKECLSWGDPEVAHSLEIHVLNRDVREKLKTHNYCRNPNSNRENKPWCFTGPRGEKEHCDIPPCGNLGSQRSVSMGQCMPKHFECSPGECIPSTWVCDGEEDCTDGRDESNCVSYMDLYQKYSKHKLEGYDVQKWLHTSLKTCALRCKEADFTCRSFSHKADENICFLSDSNVGMTGSLKPNKEYDYYEMKDRSVDCKGMYVCENRKCINQSQVCNGKNDCNDRSDETICTVENLDYDIRLAGTENDYQGRVEVKILGVWGQVCDDGFGMIDADVICKELGFVLGALEVTPGGFFGNMDPPTRFMVDQLKCRGNETSLRECDFDGWGVHNCQPEEAVGVVCKTAVNTCQDGHWKCDKSPACIPTAFICDEVVDCPDGSDENSEHCDAPFEIRLVNGSSPLEGRVEVRHHGIWGTVCDDDFSVAAATVICRSLGYGGPATPKKDGYFGPGEGPIWLDEVFCHGNETQLYRCDHNHWGQHNCNHDEDAGVICTPGDVNDSKLHLETVLRLPEKDINDILPANCGRRFKDFNEDEDLIFEKVVRGNVASKGSYPWQASIRVRGHSRSNHWCGAVIVSPLHVLTAAHCLEGYNKGTYFVRAGDYNTEMEEGTEIDADIEDYYIHEEFRKGHRMNNDIALVLLKRRGIPLGKDVMPICLPSEQAEYPPGLNCTISGFGSVETGKSTHSKDLRYGWIPLLDQSVCRAGHVYGEGAISDGMVCAGYLDEGIDTCDGDSGGPLVCLHNGAFTLYGLTSWGQHCGKANKPGVYVRVSHYRQWIDRKIKDSLAGR
ncbi:uncharacterized protein LOC122535258 isoform X3 [Frieseomelitta varia]|uniref:uncharacterized protein LOC122535258 isoform X3 n=1 Tax=Frieseomelitta varia TaxID=561572 RepID=UPI001CB6AAE9|nr:uncharacterized protein LOC122535258 isoform X3 [Frieseomelitta varia]